MKGAVLFVAKVVLAYAITTFFFRVLPVLMWEGRRWINWKRNVKP